MQDNARKRVLSGKDVLTVLDGVRELVVANRNKIVRFDLGKQRPSDEQLIAAMTGPTGNLRAPTVRRGKRLIVGFHPDVYEDEF